MAFSTTFRHSSTPQVRGRELDANLDALGVYVDGTFLPITSASTQAEQEAGTSTTTYVSPGRQKYHPSAAKAWIYMNGTGTVAINASYNVTSITDNGTGDYTVTFTTAFSSANYAAIVSSKKSGSGVAGLTRVVSRATGSFRILTTDSSGSAIDVEELDIVFFGDQ